MNWAWKAEAGRDSVLQPVTGECKKEGLDGQVKSSEGHGKKTEYSSRASTAGSRSRDYKSCGYWTLDTGDLGVLYDRCTMKRATVETSRHYESTRATSIRVHACWFLHNL